MKYRLLDLLVCPECSGELTLKGEQVGTVRSGSARFSTAPCRQVCGYLRQDLKEVTNPPCSTCFASEIEKGFLECQKCSKRYEIRNGIPRFVDSRPNDAGSRQVKNRFEFQWESWGDEAKIFGRSQAENDDYVLSGWSASRADGFFKGKIALDGGCGHGRFLRSFASFGAEVVGLDFGAGIETAARFNEADATVYPVQGDLLKPPIRKGSIDYSFSTGVIHHTPDPKRAFHNLALATRSGGTLFIWVYPKGTSTWEVSQKAIRAVTTRLPARILYALCFLPVPLLSIVKTYSSTSLRTASWRQCAQVVYDWYSPEYQFHYSHEELESWFKEEGFDGLERFSIATGMAGMKR